MNTVGCLKSPCKLLKSMDAIISSSLGSLISKLEALPENLSNFHTII